MAVLLAAQTAKPQGTLYVSSLDEPSAGSATVGSNSWLAALFVTGNNAGGYALDSVQLAMTPASGAPEDFTATVYSVGTAQWTALPGSSVGTLSGCTDPVTAGIFTYTASDLALSPLSTYFIVLTAGTAVSSGAYAWSVESTSYPSVNGGWTAWGPAISSSDGLNWEGTSPDFLQFGLTATAVPEPDPLCLLGLPALLFFAWRRSRSTAA